MNSGLEGFLHLCQHRLATGNITCRNLHLAWDAYCAPGIGGHHEDYVSEVCLLTLVIGQSGIVHHLEQDVVDVAMRLLNLIEQEHAVWCLADGIGQMSAVLIAHVSGWRTDEFSHGMLLGVFTHIEAHQLDAELLSQDTDHLGLTHSRRSHEEQRSHRLVIVHQSCLRHHHSLNHLIHSLVLTIDLVEYALAERSQGIIVFILDGSRIYLADLGKNLLDDRPW